MKAKPDCIACMFKQALNSVRLVTRDEQTELRVLTRVAQTLANPDLNTTPAALSQPAYEAVKEITGTADPFLEKKRITNRVALSILPKLEYMVDASDDPMLTALRTAAAGNVIDFGVGHKFNLEKDIERIMQHPFARSSYQRFQNEIRPGRRILYLGDNSGEIVLDQLPIKQLLNAGTRVVFTVKSGPIINDATMEDAKATGMTKLVKVIETGGADIGINWNNISPQFREEYEKADIIIAKGHGNYETCNDRPENIYFLLQAKCPMVADSLNVAVGDIVFLNRNDISP